MAPLLGIDLGTTNSLACAFQHGRPVLVPNALGQVLTPSCVSLDADGAVLVGQAARDRLVSHPGRTAAAFKRYMGTARELDLAERRFRPEELSALVLRALKADAEAFLGAPVEEAVVTVPAYFSDAQRKATRAAGQLAGLRVERLLNEPTAAALAYGLHEGPAAEGKLLVFDLGGGTFDVSVLERFEGVMEVRATAGDNFLGGEDFTQAIEDWFLAGAGRGLPGRGDPALAGLRRAAEMAKRRLGEADVADVVLPWEGRELRATLTRDAYDALLEPLLARLRRPVERALRDARLRPTDLHRVVLAGGATRMPAVRRLVARLFGQLPLQMLDPDEVVARGAAVQAGLKARDQALDEMVMTDVAPYTLGIEISRDSDRGLTTGHYMPIIERNTVVPCSRVERVVTVRDNQRRMTIEVYQGEARQVADNIKLGKLTIQVPPGKAEEQAVDVRFTYDTNGILEVQARSVGSGEGARLVIEENPGVLTPAQVAQRLAALDELKLHPRERAEHRALLARAGRLYEELLGDRRDMVGRAAERFEAVLDWQDVRAAAVAAAELSELLNRLDGDGGW